MTYPLELFILFISYNHKLQPLLRNDYVIACATMLIDNDKSHFMF